MFDNNTPTWIVAIFLLLVALIPIGRCTCSQSECASICTENGAKSAWTFTQGCYCKDSDGVYNPKDSRDR